LHLTSVGMEAVSMQIAHRNNSESTILCVLPVLAIWFIACFISYEQTDII